MSYQVLARKYRPANFEALEGQEHVLQALVNALENARLHHAYLFTGTRGVGKTTIARILAKCLNCETGVTATPCGTCSSCTEIAEGRSVDLIEVDAASRTGVDDMRELLDNVQYMPTVSRFKVYLIDEVHMLSKSSFNAMLKTLEEPPEHVKFLFATTDPKKLPITVLSRCLQFNLKNLTPEQVVKYLGQVLDAESIGYEEAALWQLGHAADGSMRDALSLTDQAISFGNNAVEEASVRTMLGSIDQREIFHLLEAVVAEDGAAVLQKVAALSEFAPDYAGMLDDLLSVLHRLALARAVPGALDNSQGDKALIEALAAKMSAEHIQLLYQIGLVGQRDLQYAPSARVGFEMILLRMLSFTLDASAGGQPGGSSSGDTSGTESTPAMQGAPAEAAPVTTSPRVAQTLPPKVGKPQHLQAEQSNGPSPQIASLLSAINGDGAESAPANKEDAAVAKDTEEQQSQPETETAPAVPRVAEPQAAEPQADVEAPIADPDTARAALESVKQAINGADAVPTLTAEVELEQVKVEPQVETTVPAEASPVQVESPPHDTSIEASVDEEYETPEPAAAVEQTAEPVPVPGSPPPPVSADNWPRILDALALTGVTQTLAANCNLKSTENGTWLLVLNEHHASLWNASHEQRIAASLARLYGKNIRVNIEVGYTTVETPAQETDRVRQENQAQAVQDIENDANVQQLIKSFNGKLDRSSITPMQP